jgi:hypothetical protein
MKKTILWVTVGVVAGYLIWWLLPKYFREEVDPRSIEHLGKVAAELNRSVPVMVDAETELLPAQGAPGMLIYNYRLVKYSVSQLGSPEVRRRRQTKSHARSVQST